MTRLELTSGEILASCSRMDGLRRGYAGAPDKYQPVFPIGIPKEVPFTEGQMITWDHLRDGVLPVEPQLDNEMFIRMGCRWDCTNCSVPEHVRHAPEVLMRPEFWSRVFEIVEARVVERENPHVPHDIEPQDAPYVRIIGGEPSTYRPVGKVGDHRVNFGDVVDVMKAAKKRPFLMAGLFSDGASLYQQPDVMAELLEVEERHHTSVDYMPQDPLPPITTDSSDREIRASYGAYVAAKFAAYGVDSVANIVLIPPDPNHGERGNLDQILDISRWLWDRGVTTTYVPIIGREHRAQHGRREQAYATELQLHHAPLLKEIVQQLVEEQLVGRGMIRNSRGYLEGIPYAGVDQLIGWHDIPRTISISPNGRMGYDPVFKTMAEVRDSPGGYYGYEDHQGKWKDFRGDQYLGMLERELAKWEAVVESRRAVATRVDPAALVETITSAMRHWTQHASMLEPSNGDQGAWWDNTIKNTKVGRFRGIYRKANPNSIPSSFSGIVYHA